MEDMARLGVLERCIGDIEIFINALKKLLEVIKNIVDSPENNEYRKVKKKSIIVSLIAKFEESTGYLKYVGFDVNGDNVMLRDGQSMVKLKASKEAIERKLAVLNSTKPETTKKSEDQQAKPSSSIRSAIAYNANPLRPVFAVDQRNDFLSKVESYYNAVLKFEVDDYIALALEKLPVAMVQMRAIVRMREQQRKLKLGEITGRDMTFEVAQLLELMSWFKYMFFAWFDKPTCKKCSLTTEMHSISTRNTPTESIRVEIYICGKCGQKYGFPRYNDPSKLLEMRAGRCGEWANCFMLFCRALQYDTRLVVDWTDHVWCEVFDHEANRWLHIDPCEGKLNAPLMYEHGWKKKLTYIIAFSKDDIQDVTWRYSSQHKEVRKRRNEIDESLWVTTLVKLRRGRQQQVSEVRRNFLNRRCIEELVQLLAEKSPTDYENHGRISGGAQWRHDRGELGEKKMHTFEINTAGVYTLKYFTSSDKYELLKDYDVVASVQSWFDGCYEWKNVFRKQETDWKMVYIAREEDAAIGRISWKLSALPFNIRLYSASIRVTSKLYENGVVRWIIKFDNEEEIFAQLRESATTFQTVFKDLVITAELSGGRGDVAWQHSQLFRQAMDSKSCAFEIVTTARICGPEP